MPRPHILTVEDDEDIQQLISYNLIKKDYQVSCASSGSEAFQILEEKIPDLIILDLMLPGFDGYEICKRVRSDSRLASVPIIMLTAKGEESDIVRGLEAGADDYVTKPFSPKVLLARINTILRRRRPAQDKAAPDEMHDSIAIHELQINVMRHEVLVDGAPVQLTMSEFNILRFLAAHPGRVYTRQQIIDEIRGYGYTITDRAVDVQVFGLRKKLGQAGEYIETVRGLGYRFRE